MEKKNRTWKNVGIDVLTIFLLDIIIGSFVFLLWLLLIPLIAFAVTFSLVMISLVFNMFFFKRLFELPPMYGTLVIRRRE